MTDQPDGLDSPWSTRSTRSMRPTGRCSSTSCGSWPGAFPTNRPTEISTRDYADVPGVGRALEPGRALARRSRRRKAGPRRALHGQRPLPAVDRRVRGGPQGRRGHGAGEHAPLGRRGADDPASRRADRDHHERPAARERAGGGTGDAYWGDADNRRMVGTRRVRPERRAGARRRRRHGRHHVHVGHDRPAEGRARPPSQRRDDPQRCAELDRPRLAARRAAVHVRGA